MMAQLTVEQHGIVKNCLLIRGLKPSRGQLVRNEKQVLLSDVFEFGLNPEMNSLQLTFVSL